ncbi:hypothetical protein TSUD_85690 [Trifolium subterraneum]|uniref:Uncharacterized protein n=1 Tax=Trifolium subterraneum TaxID=3900 RepID=A0A2Z6NSI7_TRISU|nr:hypothetical protein TSUD_85690 [Trifolium subterraneum]
MPFKSSLSVSLSVSSSKLSSSLLVEESELDATSGATTSDCTCFLLTVLSECWFVTSVAISTWSILVATVLTASNLFAKLTVKLCLRGRLLACNVCLDFNLALLELPLPTNFVFCWFLKEEVISLNGVFFLVEDIGVCDVLTFDCWLITGVLWNEIFCIVPTGEAFSDVAALAFMVVDLSKHWCKCLGCAMSEFSFPEDVLLDSP